ncbi:hypothetical protein GCM10009584_24000 [Ornithinimicrobium humiphilum]
MTAGAEVVSASSLVGGALGSVELPQPARTASPRAALMAMADRFTLAPLQIEPTALAGSGVLAVCMTSDQETVVHR